MSELGSARHPNDSRPDGRGVETRSLTERLLEALPVASYFCDVTGLITWFNRHAELLWGRAPRLGDPADRFCGSYRLFDRAGNAIAHEACWMALALQTGHEYLGGEIIIERPDGVRIPVMAYASPLRDEHGAIRGAVNVLIDMRDRERADEMQRLLAAIVESTDDAVVSKTLDGVIQSWNLGAERIFGYTSDEIVGRSVKVLIPPERWPEEDEILSRLRQGESVSHLETVRITKDGRRLDISLTSSPVRDAEGRIVAASKIARDITAQKAAEVALREANQAKNRFLALLGHELRNPLAPIRNAVHAARASGEARGEIAQALSVIDRQTIHLVRLVDDLLDVSRLQNDRLGLRIESMDLTQAIGAAIEQSGPLIQAAGHELQVDVRPGRLTLRGDPTRLAQIVSNLLGNAAKYTPSGGHIVLSVGRSGDQLVIRVRDDGIGIPPENLESIFDMFTQVAPGPGRHQQGLGLGLTLVKRLVELHGGRVEARSRGLGHGSEFIVHLPAAEEPPLAERPARARARSRARGARILVVDDNQDAAKTLVAVLRLQGHDARAVFDGPAALALGASLQPNIALLDLVMPEMDGYELADAIRREPWGADTALVAVSGWDRIETDGDRQDAFHHRLTKPVDPSSLLELVENLAPVADR